MIPVSIVTATCFGGKQTAIGGFCYSIVGSVVLKRDFKTRIAGLNTVCGHESFIGLERFRNQWDNYFVKCPFCPPEVNIEQE